ncbi:hypothetical protein EVAR_2647_1 [Eumeta japonica]|uniref:Uncharacterized protein n=1 Tax=Eumeta variegata TaxID=151549 RepID=A0A4C1SML9_EUMVA|nr:hypothetical protein EVAR_2647_1 [Eumeta japonica]
MEPSSAMLNKWMTALESDELSQKDKKLLNSLKNRIKGDQMKNEDDRHMSNERGSIRDRERERERERALLEQQRKNRESERRDERQRAEEHMKDKHSDRKDSPLHASSDKGDKKPEPRKMPFIGKMPVYKSLGKTSKPEEPKKDDKKKEEEEAAKKRREEMDAEIQKKVAEFKEKIARAQLERESMPRLELGPPGVVIPTELGASVQQLHAPPQLHPIVPAPAPAPVALRPQAPPLPQQPPANLSKDFQEALDIIFPADEKKDMSQEQGVYPAAMGGFVPQMGGVVPSYPPMNMMPPMNPQMMMGYDMNTQMFQRPQLYESQMPVAPRTPAPTSAPTSAPIPTLSSSPSKKAQHLSNINSGTMTSVSSLASAPNAPNSENGEVSKKQAELDDLALLGIDASDVGAGI